MILVPAVFDLTEVTSNFTNSISSRIVLVRSMVDLFRGGVLNSTSDSCTYLYPFVSFSSNHGYGTAHASILRCVAQGLYSEAQAGLKQPEGYGGL